MAIVGFQQADGYPNGAGMFNMDDGSSLFAHDPDAAAPFLAPQPPPQPPPMQPQFALPQQPDPALLAKNEITLPDQDMTGPQAAPQQMADVQPSMAPPAPAMPQISPEDTARAALNGSVIKYKTPHAAVAAGYTPHAKSETVETTAPQMSQEEIDKWGAGHLAMAQAQRAQAVHQATIATTEAAQLQKQLPDLQKQVAEAKARQVRVEQGVQEDQAAYNQLLDQQKSKKVDPKHWFTSASTIGQIGIILGQALGAYGATLGHSENYAQKMIDGIIRADIASQESAIDSGQKNVDNALKRLTLKFGDRDQAKSALYAIQQQSAATLRESFAKGAQSQDIQDKQAIWEAQHQQQMAKEARDFTIQSYGKHTANVSSQYHAAQAAVAAGTIDWKATKENAAGAAELQQIGAIPDTSREGQKLEIERDKAARASRKVDPGVAKAQEQLSAVESSLKSAAELDRLYAKPLLSRAERGRMESLQAVSPLEVHKALTGLSKFSDAEGDRYAYAYGHPGETMDITGKHRGALGAIREQLAQKKAELEKAVRSGAGVAGPEQGAPDIQDVE